ncbi:MAG: hypothetical protein JXA20_05220 [Spirochaetes bacterium]|nr:hypothetical protein [Spirochaetota bacterium]
MKRALIFFSLVFLLPGIVRSGDGSTGQAVQYPKRSYRGVEALYRRYSCRVRLTKLKGTLDGASMRDWSDFRTRIKEGARKRVNFGGKYIIVQWGCGTECHTGAIIDAETGKIFNIPISERGLEYRRDSLLLIVNPPSRDEGEGERPNYAYPAYYLWKENGFELLKDTRK